MAGGEQRAAVYVSWATFKNSVEQLAGGLPNRIDRTVFPSMAGGVQSQLLAGFRFLGLIDEDDHPTDQLKKLAVPNEAGRREVLKAVLEARYSELFSLDLTRATPAQIDERMSESYGVAGDTRRKAVRFFLAAVEYVGIEVSPLLSKTTGKKNGNGKTIRRRTSRRRSRSEERPPPPPSDSGSSKEIHLRSGGTLRILASLDLFSLEPSDRAFVFELIDRLDEYERKSPSVGTGDEEPPEGER